MPPQPPPLSTPHSLHTHLLNFLTLSIHTILHARGLYPASTFLLTRAFNFPVPQNRHPVLCAYINSCVSALTPHLQSGSLSSVSIVIYSSSTSTSPNPEIQILERYMFDISRFPRIPPQETLTTFENRASGDPSSIRTIDVEEELRATLRKLAYSASKLSCLAQPEECTWGVVMEMKEGEGNAPIGHPQPFEPAMPELQLPPSSSGSESARTTNVDLKGKGKAGGNEHEHEAEMNRNRNKNSRVGRARGGIKSTAIRAVEVGEFIMEAWIEEGDAKFPHQDGSEQ
ncbi:hypothetical protein NHQ30_004823 [Ciborinia camelliae]|nr:hypothetical protein NHQ30_004823 [Ciborinia camelliae]